MIHPVKNKTIYNKLVKLCAVTCPVCNEYIYSHDHANIEYVKTNRGSEIFIHTECVKHWGDEV